MSYKQQRLKQTIEFLGLYSGCDYIYKDKRYTFKYKHGEKNYVLVNNEEAIPVVELPLIEVASIKKYHWEIDNKKIKDISKLNKYNLKPNSIKKAILINKDKLTQKPFWRNDVVNAWCLSGGVGKGTYSGCDSSYWIGFFDNGSIDYHLDCMEGMCNYNITEFFNLNDIQNENDELLQIKYLEALNYLIDEKIIEIKGE